MPASLFRIFCENVFVHWYSTGQPYGQCINKSKKLHREQRIIRGCELAFYSRRKPHEKQSLLIFEKKKKSEKRNSNILKTIWTNLIFFHHKTTVYICKKYMEAKINCSSRVYTQSLKDVFEYKVKKDQ